MKQIPPLLSESIHTRTETKIAIFRSEDRVCLTFSVGTIETCVWLTPSAVSDLHAALPTTGFTGDHYEALAEALVGADALERFSTEELRTFARGSRSDC